MRTETSAVLLGGLFADGDVCGPAGCVFLRTETSALHYN